MPWPDFGGTETACRRCLGRGVSTRSVGVELAHLDRSGGEQRGRGRGRRGLGAESAAEPAGAGRRRGATEGSARAAGRGHGATAGGRCAAAGHRSGTAARGGAGARDGASARAGGRAAGSGAGAAPAELRDQGVVEQRERPDRCQRRQRLGVRAKLAAVLAASLTTLDVVAHRARRLAQALGRLGELEPDLAAGELARCVASASDIRARTSSDFTAGTVVSIVSAISS